MTAAALPSPTSPPRTDELREQRKREIRVASKYRGELAVRIIFEMVWGLAAWGGVIALAVSGVLPYWLGCLANGWIAYLMYMPLHEATHGNVHGRHAKLLWLDDIVGHLSSIPLWFSFSSHRTSHMKHHAHTNDPTRDPDFFVAGPLPALVMKNVILAVLQTIVPVLTAVPSGLRILPGSLRNMALASRERRRPEEVRAEAIFIRLCFAAFVALSLAGYFKEAFLLWWLPSRIGMFLMTFFFAWLPHHPHHERGRYRDTRITLFPGSRILIRGQDRHLLHHMFPRVPHYRLPPLFDEIRPDLEAHGARIEGPLAGPGAPPIGMR